MSLRLVTPPTSEPIDVDWVRSHLRMDLTDEEQILEGFIAAARQKAEQLSGECFMTQTWEMTLCRFPVGRQSLQLLRKPVQSIESITYVDTAGVSQNFGTLNDDSPAVISEYTLIRDKENPRLSLNLGYDWPLTASVEHAVTIRFVAGYGDEFHEVPEIYKVGIALAVGHFDQNREDTKDLPKFVLDLIGVPKIG